MGGSILVVYQQRPCLPDTTQQLVAPDWYQYRMAASPARTWALHHGGKNTAHTSLNCKLQQQSFRVNWHNANGTTSLARIAPIPLRAARRINAFIVSRRIQSVSLVQVVRVSFSASRLVWCKSSESCRCKSPGSCVSASRRGVTLVQIVLLLQVRLAGAATQL